MQDYSAELSAVLNDKDASFESRYHKLLDILNKEKNLINARVIPCDAEYLNTIVNKRMDYARELYIEYLKICFEFNENK